MGILVPHCTAWDSKSTVLYSVSSGRNFEVPGYNEHIVVFKSNTNPTVFTDISWSTVATVDKRAFPGFAASSCVVDDQGVLTMFGSTTIYAQAVSAGNKPGVIRYDPTASKTTLRMLDGTELVSTGTGSWTNITVSELYPGSMNSKISKLFYVKNTVAGGASTLMHIALDSRGRTLIFGVLDENTKILSHAANWTLDVKDTQDTLKTMTYSNGHLFTYWTTYSTSRMSAYPLTNLTSTVPPNPRVFNTNTTSAICSDTIKAFSGTLDNTFYLVCPFYWAGSGFNSKYDTTLFKLNDASLNGSSFGEGIRVPRSLVYMTHFVPIAATPEYAFMVDDRYGTAGSYALVMSGDNAGTVWGPKDVFIPETYGKDPNAKPTDSNPESSSLSSGAILGVVVGVLAVVGLLSFCLYRSSNKNKNKKQATVTGNQTYTQGHNQTEVVTKPGQTTQYIIRPAVVPMAQVPGTNGPYQMNTAGQPHLAGAYPQMSGQPMYPTPQAAPIAISDARIITPATIATTTTTTAPSYQPVQNQMQHPQFSSHPRPNFITTIGGNGQSNNHQDEVKTGPDSVTFGSPNTSLSVSFDPNWEPQPWTPSTHLTSSSFDPSTPTEQALPPSPYHETSSGLWRRSPGAVNTNNPQHRGDM